MELESLETAEGSEFPLCRQLSVFLENRLGQLHRLTRLFESADIRIRGLSVEGSIDCAIVRLVVDNPDLARSMMADGGFALTETDILVIELPTGSRGIMRVCGALIAGEVNINYLYPLLPNDAGVGFLAVQVDNLSQAAAVLGSAKFNLVDQSEL
jgi:hypothetical protein